METSMASELNMLAHRLNAISEKHRTSRDFTLGALTRALREVIAAFPVYRTYVTAAQSPPDRRAPEAAEGAPTANTGVITDRDREYVRRAVAHRHARHQAGRGSPRAHQRALRDPRGVAPPRRALAAPQPPPAHDGGRPRGAGRQYRVPDLPDAGGRVAGRPRPAPRIPLEGGPRGQDAHVVDQSRRPLRRGHRRLRGGAARSHALAGLPRRLHRVPGARRPLRRPQLAGADADQDHGARRPRLLPGHRAVGPEPRRPRQPPAGGLGAAPPST